MGAPVSTYEEVAPSPRFRQVVECFWRADAIQEHTHRVLPDGCADLLLRVTGRRFRFEIVKVMTSAQLLRISRGERFAAVRFRPGMAAAVLPSSGLVSEFFRGQDPRGVARAVAGAECTGEFAEEFERALGVPRELDRAQEALALLAERKGEVSLEELSEAACASERQFRRQCERLSGVSPKVLARILRFREASLRLASASPGNLASIALDCGYCDQPHFQREFRAFAGITPGELGAG